MNFRQVLNGARRRWVHWKNNRRMVGLARQVAGLAPRRNERPVVFFNASTRLEGMSLNASFSLVASWALRMQGTPVVHFVCAQGLRPCVLGTQRDDPLAKPPCRACQAQSRAVYHGAKKRPFVYREDAALRQALQGRSVADLTALEYGGVPLGRLVTPALRWILRRHTLEENAATRTLLCQYLLSAYSLAQQFGELLDDVKPQAVVVFNGQFYPEATARWVAQQRGLRVITHEVGLLPTTAYFTPGEATAYPIDIPETFDLDEAQNRQLDEYLEKRFQGNFSMAGVQFWPEMQPLGEDFWQRASKFRQIVPIFTNVVFDTSQGHANVLFPHMFAWLDQTLEVIRAHPETLFVIRAHPDELRPGKESRESVAMWAEERNVRALPNVLFVDATEYFSSYELIQRSKFVMIYNSTIGLEASLMGAAVLCAGKARFTQLQTVFLPPTAEAYRQMVEEFLASETITPPAEHQRNARRFLYYQLFRTSLPFGRWLEEDGVWRGYTVFKPKVTWQDLLTQYSPVLRTVVDGILKGESFLKKE